MNPQIPIDRGKISAFCRTWQVTRLELFGSVVREDFSPTSDVDVLVSFAAGDQWDLFDLVDMKEQLEEIFGRKVDILTRRAVESSRNRYRRDAILASAIPLYSV